MANKVEKVMCGASDLGIACGGALTLGGVARNSDLQSNATLGGGRKKNNMKKLMFAAAALAAGFALADVTSANVVGYSSITVEPGFHLFTATFEDVAGNEYKLNEIKILNEDGTEWDVKSGTEVACNIQKMTTDGKGYYDSSKIYTYRHYYMPPPPRETDNGLGWYVGSSTSSRVTDDITIKNGEGLSINNKAGKNIKLRFSGAVTLTGRSFKVAPGFSLVGNLTPVDVKLKDVVILNEDGTPWDVKSGSEVACNIQKMTTDGKGYYDSSKIYTYRHYYMPPPPRETDNGLGWYVGSSTSSRVTDDIIIPAGEAVSINNKAGADIIVVFPSPITPKETSAE